MVGHTMVKVRGDVKSPVLEGGPHGWTYNGDS